MIEFDESKGKIESEVKNILSMLSHVSPRIVKPASLDCRDLWAEVEHEPRYDCFPVQSREELDIKVRTYNGYMLKCPWGTDRDYFRAIFSPVVPNESFLIHGTGQRRKVLFGNLLGDLRAILNTGTVGDLRESRPMYLRGVDLEVEDCELNLGGGGYWLHVNVKELLKWRTLFYDPEGLFNQKEFGLTFITFGGIPLRAIMKVSGTSYSDRQARHK